MYGTLILVGVLLATFLVLARNFWRRSRGVEVIAEWARTGGHVMTGDGVQRPLSVVGTIEGRPFSVTFQYHPDGDTLLVAVDCRSAADGLVSVRGMEATERGESGPAGDPRTNEAIAGGAALSARWRPPPEELLDPDRLDALLKALHQSAEELEVTEPEEEGED